MIGWIALVLALLPAGLVLANLRHYVKPVPFAGRPQLSVLIPARNEEANIGDAVTAVLASKDVDLEIIVMDDGSTDSTRAILDAIDDSRVRVADGGGLPPGWSGKQHACAALARLARHDVLVFVDADVRLAPDALNRMAGFLEREKLALASGFPRQVTRSWSEILLLPLIYFVLLGYLPIGRMKRSAAPSLGAGCGQLFIARAKEYALAGGHGAIRASLHDGLMLPRAFRRAGFMTGLFDASSFATCRMYANVAQVWEGLTKNATEGMAKPLALPVWTVILGGGAVLPLSCVALAPTPPAIAALACGVGIRLVLAWRFGQPVVSALLHPLGVAALLFLQWAALMRAAFGRPATWRGRAYTAQT